jgi:hypothetical protein
MKTIFLILAFSLTTFAQIKATTEDGKKVILNADKSWDYVAPVDTNAPAILYVYRLKETGVYNKARELRIDGKEILELRQGDFVGIKIAPGKHVVRSNKEDSEIELNASGGETYFIKLIVGYGGFNQTFILSEVPKATAVFDIKKTNFIDEKQLKSSDVNLVKIKPE